MKKRTERIAILGAGLAGCCAALNLARHGIAVTLFDRLSLPVHAASLHNEGKLHLGYVYAMDKGARTYVKMIEGSLQFLGIVEYLTGINKSNFTLSSPFMYGVSNTSMLPMEKILDHFHTVDEEINNFLSKEKSFTSIGQSQPANVLAPEQAKRWFDMSAVHGVIQTPEISVNPIEVANIISASVLSNDLIEFKGNCEIEGVSESAANQYQIHYTEHNQSTTQKIDAGINCLWEDRIRIDKTLGIYPHHHDIIRYKSTITFYDRSKKYLDTPSTTIVLGPYGDTVNYRNGLYYLSWYPDCKIGETTDGNIESLKSEVDKLNRDKLMQSNIEELTTFLPSIEQFKDIIEKGRVGGGFICAQGKTDIQDLNSGLHSRNNIGVQSHNHWLTVNTGKYCTAPLYGLKASNQLLHLL